MTVVFYKPSCDRISERLQRAIKKVTPEGDLEVYQTIDGLLKRIVQLSYNNGIAVLLTSSKKELDDLLRKKEQLRDTRLILILPYKDDLTISTGYALYPRFLSYADSDFRDVALVLERMIDLSEKRHFAEAEAIGFELTS